MNQVTDIKYITTKVQCQAAIDAKPVVCSSCGGKIEPIETVDNSDRPTYWAGCIACNHFDHGVSLEAFMIAKEMVMKYHHSQYTHVKGQYGTPEEQDYYYKTQIGGTSRFISNVFAIQKRLQMEALNPAKGAVINTMNTDPNLQAASEQEAAPANEQATTEKLAAVEQEAQEQAMESSEEGGT